MGTGVRLAVVAASALPLAAPRGPSWLKVIRGIGITLQ